eukprot:gb/GEZN01005275.1/.p1 GENE.gb/GEZN01005275.1/~~gb/GEZN01005275.1/.p1  ORF type:complete len:563 (-),score=63.82 gb/GEZN01005275.1/:137-1729(-)
MLGETSALLRTEPKGIVGLPTSFAVYINYLIGTGVFSLPLAFYASGWFLALVSFLVFGCLSLLTALWIPDVMSRTQGLLATSVATSSSLSSLSSNEAAYKILTPKPTLEQLQLSYRRLDYTLMCEVFGGTYLKYACQIIVMFYGWSCLWGYVVVFSSSMDSVFFQYVLGQECDMLTAHSAGCEAGYYLWLFFFSVFCISMFTRDISEQAGVQTFMTAYRFFTLVLMMTTVMVALQVSEPPPSPDTLQRRGTGFFKLDGFATTFSYTSLAFSVHYNLPDIIQPLRRREKKFVPLLIVGGQLCGLIFYLLLAWLAAYFFSARTLPLVTLNWESYTGLDGGWGQGPARGFSYLVKALVICFPAVNMMSAYPLIVLSLAQNLSHLSILQRYFPAASVSEKEKNGKDSNNNNSNHHSGDGMDIMDGSLAALPPREVLKIKICRVICGAPPLLLGAMIHNLGVILKIAGLCGFCLLLFIPSLLQLLSIHHYVSRWGAGAEKTPYSTCLSSRALAVFLLLVSSVFFSYSVAVVVSDH